MITDHNSLYAELTKDADPRVKISFIHIKEACDDILKVAGKLNYSTVGKWCEEKFAIRSDDGTIIKHGQPSVKTIQQNRFNYKAYIDARKTQSSIGKKLSKLSITDNDDNYPALNLDHATKLHINNLRSQVKRLSRDLKIVESRFTEMQKDRPIELERLLSYAGSNQDGVPFDTLMITNDHSQDITDTAREALHYLLFELDKSGIVKRMPENTDEPQSTWVNVVTSKPILTIEQYLALRDFWESIQ